MAASRRFTVTLDDDSADLLERLEKFTGLSPAQTIQKLFPAHLEELWAYLEWLELLPDDAKQLRNRGMYLLQSYGPNSLIEDIKKLDPAYKSPSERIAAELAGKEVGA